MIPAPPRKVVAAAMASAEMRAIVHITVTSTNPRREF
jgi:hypothetical protein